MSALPSGLPESVAGNEDLVRFLVQSNQFSSTGARPAAFLPNPKHRNTSVFRGRDLESLRRTFEAARTDGRPAKAVAMIPTRAVRITGLNVFAEEPPERHANIEGWSWLETDPELRKARHLELVGNLASVAEVTRL